VQPRFPRAPCRARRILLIQTQAENAGAREISRLVGAGLAAHGYDVQAETFGLAALEAAHAGVVAVVNDISVLREVLSYQGKPAARFVDASDHAKLSASVCRAPEDKALRETLRQNAQGIKARYSVDTMVEEYVRIIGDAANDAGLAQQASAT
jgi:glycosyltransferase involved in cell wall biosynthesis